MDPPGKNPIIAVSAGLRWLTEVLAWKRGWDFVSRAVGDMISQEAGCHAKCLTAVYNKAERSKQSDGNEKKMQIYRLSAASCIYQRNTR